MDQEDLKQAREDWYAAYFAGDLEGLAEVQADRFTVTTERGVQSKRSQIDAISSAKRSGSWFPEGGEKHDTELAFQDSDGRTIITGKGFTIAGQVKGPMIAFTETWQWDGSTWRVVSLSCSTVRNES